MHRTEILQTAAKLTAGERDKTYGPPTINMSAAMRLIQTWREVSAGLHERQKHIPQMQRDAHEAAIEMALTKLGRIATGAPHADNYIDAAAYIAIAGEQVLGAERP